MNHKEINLGEAIKRFINGDTFYRTIEETENSVSLYKFICSVPSYKTILELIALSEEGVKFYI